MLKTTATYDPSTKEFILNTPTQADCKFWIGNLAKTAHRGVVFAQLITLGKKQGVHAFVIDLRERKTHRVLPGLTIGDCGPKEGLHGMDNGFVIFKDYRVPKFALLDKLSSIADDGTYDSPIKDKNKRFATTVAALSSGRVLVCKTGGRSGIIGSIIALRYAHLRKQFTNEGSAEGAIENTLIDYQLHQKRLIPHFATAIVNTCAGEEVELIYKAGSKDLLDKKAAE
jgi:acyl-CoA oxidase